MNLRKVWKIEKQCCECYQLNILFSNELTLCHYCENRSFHKDSFWHLALVPDDPFFVQNNETFDKLHDDADKQQWIAIKSIHSKQNNSQQIKPNNQSIQGSQKNDFGSMASYLFLKKQNIIFVIFEIQWINFRLSTHLSRWIKYKCFNSNSSYLQ